MKDENTIKKICEKTGADWNYWESLIRRYYPDKAVEHQLLGFLKSKETLIAVFGEEAIPTSDETVKAGVLYVWQYHHNNMGYTLDEILAYYEKFLEVKE